MRRGNDIAIGLLVIGDGLHAKDLAQLMHQLALLTIHGGKGVASRLLFALLGQLHQISERFIDALS